MSDQGDKSFGVRVGDVTGGIHGSILAGRDVSNASISVGGKEMRGGDPATQADLAELLADIGRTLQQIQSRQAELSGVSAAAPFAVQGAAASVQAAAERVQGDVTTGDAASAQKGLEQAATLVTTVLETTGQVAEAAEGAGNLIKSLTESLGPLLEKIAVAAVWVGRLWLGGI